MAATTRPSGTLSEGTTAEWVYCGERLGKAGKVMHEWVPLDALDDEAQRKWYGPKNIARQHAVVGGVYVVTVDGDDSVFSSGPKAPRYVHNLDVNGEAGRLLATWKARHAETQVMTAASSAVRKAKKEHGGLGALTLDQLAAQYRRAGSGPRRNALIASVIGHLTSTRVNDVLDD